jgi:asparagine synthase (glutamine-hydrolysing)
MCGIAGYYSADGHPVGKEAVEPMLKAIQHRGPDGFGVYSDSRCVLGHARLSIIDIDGGWQPIFNENNTLAVVFNGEIYNYLELSQELIQRGHRFRTRSDTEVILHAYEEWGDRCLVRFNGQFSFVVYETASSSLFIARDRLGVRPFYYTWSKQSFVFASEVKALFASGLAVPELDEGLQELFVYWTNISPNTPFRNVHELPPGHMMTVSGDRSRISRYWEVPSGEETDLGPEEYAEGVDDHLRRSIKLRLRADVPVGAYLSGGLDSALTTALIRRVTDTPLKTFSVEFTDPEYDESVYQKELVRFLGTDHSSIRCSPSEISEHFEDAIWAAERPLLRTAPVPMYLLSRLVRSEGYKVVVTGEGADEFFLGYDIFKEAKVRQFCSRYPDSRFRPLLLRRLYPYLFRDPRAVGFQQAFFLKRFQQIDDPFYGHRLRWDLGAKVLDFLREDRKAISMAGTENRLLSNLPSGFAGSGPLGRTQMTEVETLLSGYLLSSQGDRVANSIEGRFPFLDHELIEFASRIPARRKMSGLDEKRVLKDLGKGILPPGVLRRKKFPYRAPDFLGFMNWVRGKEFLEERLAPEAVARVGLFDPGKVTRLFQKAYGGRQNGLTSSDNLVLMAVLSTQIFIRRFFGSWEDMKALKFTATDYVRVIPAEVRRCP